MFINRPNKLITSTQLQFLENNTFPDLAISIIRDCNCSDENFLTLNEFKKLDKDSLNCGELIFIKDTGQIFVKIDDRMEEINY